MKAGRLDRRVTVLAPVKTRDETYGSVSVEWIPQAEVWAEVQDVLPSRAERVAEGVNIARRPSRVRMRWRDDVNSAMRFEVDGRTMRIVAGPAELGRREGLEFIAEELTTEGQDA